MESTIKPSGHWLVGCVHMKIAGSVAGELNINEIYGGSWLKKLGNAVNSMAGSS